MKIKLWLRCGLAALVAAAAWVVMPPSRAADDKPAGIAPRRVKVLFLGDNDLHHPIDRARLAYTPLAERGIDLTYSDNPADLNPANLGRYDCLLLYANWKTIEPAQEKALLNYVEGGHGFVPIHCGSYCFLNSPKITALVGGRFKSHGTGTFKETIAAPDHPIEKGLKPIESWDESYVHDMHNEQGRTVLGYRVDGEKKEPYTWVRNQGKGRVFYTAWGHDERTWTNENFLALLERGVKWAAGDWALGSPAPLAAFTYGEGVLPNYLAGKAWGTTGDLITKVQNPLEPAESIKHLVVPPGFAPKLVAGDPDIKKPICLAFDERGRMWVAETFDYPNEMQPPGQGRDRITICEDTNGDGVADKFTVFADKLSIPTSIVFANGGVIVCQPPQMLFFKDLDGDGKADKPEERKVLIDGWGTRDTHATASNMRWGLDGWIYGTVGYSGFRGTVGGEQINNTQGQAVFRFKPDGSKLEFLGSTNNNTWGLGLTEDFEVIASTANHNPAFYLGIPNRYYETVRGFQANRPATVADDWHFWPTTEKVRQVDQHGGYTAGAGAAFYTARTYPSYYWNRVNFVCEPTGHLVGQFEWQATPTGGMAARNRFNLLGSDDEWTAPIVAEVGPDGNVWVIDWYNMVIQHNPVPRGFANGKGAAYETPLRDKRHGRVYNLVYKDGKPSPILDLSKAAPAELVAALKSDNMLWRSHAQRLLGERGQKDVVPQLVALTADTAVDEVGLNPAAIHALWALHNLGTLDGSDAAATAAAVKALAHPSAGVRKAAAAVLPRTAGGLMALVQSNVLADPDPLVKKTALLAVSEMPPSDEAGKAVYAALAAVPDPGEIGLGARRGGAAVAADARPGALPQDTGLFDAAVIAAAPNAPAFLKAAVTAAADPAPAAPAARRGPAATPPAGSAAARAVTVVAEHYARGAPADTVVATLSSLKRATPAVATAVMDGLAAGWPQGSAVKLTDADAAELKSILPALPPASQDRLLALTGRWGRADLFAAEASAIAAGLKTAVADKALDPAKRAEAATRLVTLADTADSVSLVLGQVSPQAAPEVQVALVQSFAASRGPAVPDAVLAKWAALTPTAQKAAIDLLMRRAEWATALVAGIESGTVNAKDLQLPQWQALGAIAGPTGQRARAAQKAAGKGVSPDRKAVVDKLLPLADKDGDPVNGRAVYEKNCMVCHTMDGKGGKVGPELTGIGAKPKADNLIDVLDPNKSVEGTFRLWTARVGDDVIAGRLASETKTSVEILDAANQTHVIQRDQLTALTASDKSVMPEGFEQLPPQDLTDLITFLATSKAK